MLDFKNIYLGVSLLFCAIGRKNFLTGVAVLSFPEHRSGFSGFSLFFVNAF